MRQAQQNLPKNQTTAPQTTSKMYSSISNRNSSKNLHANKQQTSSMPQNQPKPHVLLNNPTVNNNTWYEEVYGHIQKQTNSESLKLTNKKQQTSQQPITKIDNKNHRLLGLPLSTKGTGQIIGGGGNSESSDYNNQPSIMTMKQKQGHNRKYSGGGTQQYMPYTKTNEEPNQSNITSVFSSVSSNAFPTKRQLDHPIIGSSKSLQKNISYLGNQSKQQMTLKQNKELNIIEQQSQGNQFNKTAQQNIFVQYQYNNYFLGHPDILNQQKDDAIITTLNSARSPITSDHHLSSTMVVNNKNSSMTLSDKLASFNQHKMMVKNQPGSNIQSQSDNLINRSQSQDPNFEKSGQNSVGGFFSGMNKQKAIDSAFSFFHKVQSKVRNLVSQSPKNNRENPNISVDYEMPIGFKESITETQSRSFNSGSAAYKKSRIMLTQFRTPEGQRNFHMTTYNSGDHQNRSLRKSNATQKLKSIKPTEKEADSPIDPPSPRTVETFCVNCQQYINMRNQDAQHICPRQSAYSQEGYQSSKEEDLIVKIDKLLQAMAKYISDQPKVNSREEMHAASLKTYALKLKEEIKRQQSSSISVRDYEQFKELVQNIQFQEDSSGASTNMIIFIQRLKVLCRDRLNFIIKYLKNNNAQGLKYEVSSNSSAAQIPNLQRKLTSDQSQIRDDMSEDRMREKMEEVSKTIKEKEYLQKRTNDLLQAINQRSAKKQLTFNDPNIIQKGQFIISDLRSDIDNQTHVSDGSSKSKISQMTGTSSKYQANLSSLMQTFKEKGSLTRSPSGDQMKSVLSGEGDEIDETLNIQNNKREKEVKQKNKIQFYEISLNLKNKVFPESHLAKYANIPALFDEAQKRGVQADKYQDFIYQELSKNAQLWVSMKEINQLRKKSQNSQSPTNANSLTSLKKEGSNNMIQTQDYTKDMEISLKNYNGNDIKRKNSVSNGRLREGGSKGTKIETIVEEDDAQLSQYND